MTIKELKDKLDDFGDHIEVKIRLEEITKYGQYDIQDVGGGRDEDGELIVEIRI